SRALSDDELAAFVANVRTVHRTAGTAHALMILLLTGQRRGELCAARWANVDRAAGTWTIPDADAKAGRGHVVPLTSWAVEEFEALAALAGRSAFVLPAAGGKAALDPKLVTRSVARCQATWAKLGVGAWTAHDLRRTCRTGLA